jgi:uncharacterized membrane protein
MNTKKLIGTALISGAIALSLTASANGAKEKCYGITQAGQNDCATSDHSCAGKSTQNNSNSDWVYVDSGTCENQNGSINPAEN